MLLHNAQTDEIIASDVEIAGSRASRRCGLLGRERLDVAAALLLWPCCAIHTAWMRFPIDAVFVDRDGVVLKIARSLPPWRVAAAWRAHAVIELASGTPGTRHLRRGDRVYLAFDVCEAGGPGDVDAWRSSPAMPSLRRMASKPACSGS